MIFQPSKAILNGLCAFGLFLSGCQVNNRQPDTTTQPTGSIQTPTPARNQEKTAPVKKTITPTPTVTLSPHLDIDLGQLRGTQIILWHPWAGELSEQLDELTREYNKENEWGIQVNSQSFFNAGTLYDTVSSALDAKGQTLPNLVIAPSEQLTVWSTEYDVIADLSGYMVDPKVGFQEKEIGAFLPLLWEQDQVDDRQIAVPILRTAYVLYYNQTWAKELGFQSPPKTPAEFKKQACAAAVKNNTAKLLEIYGTGGWLVDINEITTLSWLQSFDPEMEYSVSSKVSSFDSPASEDALVFLRDMLDEGCAWLGRNQTPHEYFAERKALFYSGTLQGINHQKNINQLMGSSDEWVVLPYTREDGTQFVYANGYSLAILNNGSTDTEPAYKEQMAAWLFLNWISQPENQVSLARIIPSLPISTSVIEGLDENQFPWKDIIQLSDIAIPVSSHPSWRIVRRLVQDAGWQIYHLPSDQVTTILAQLDQAVIELVDLK